LTKWQKEIHRFSKWFCKNAKRDLKYRLIKKSTKDWSKEYKTFEAFKKYNDNYIKDR